MQVSTTTIPGLTFSVEVEEVNHRDQSGGLICYLASLYRMTPRHRPEGCYGAPVFPEPPRT